MVKPDITKSGKEFRLRDKIYQTNPLICARKDFNTVGMRLFFLGLRGVNPQLVKGNQNADDQFESMFISPSELKAIFGNGAYLPILKRECKKLFNAIVELNRDNGGFVLMHMFRKLEYVSGEGLYLQFDELMRPYLLDLFESGGYTMMDVEQVFYLTSPYAVRLVELMLQYQNIKPMKERGIVERQIKMDELRFMLNVPEGAYTGRLNNFCAKVLNDPIREINEKTIYQMSYDTVRLPHKEIGFKFVFDMTALLAKEAELNATGEPAIAKLRSLGFSEQAAWAIRDKCESSADCLDRITRATRSLSMKKKRSPVENELGYLRKYIEENWQSPATRAKKNKSNFPPPVDKAPLPKRPKPAPTNPPRSKVQAPLPEGSRGGEQPLAPMLIDIVKQSILTGELLTSAEAILKVRGLTIERFKELYMS